jgi:mannose-6-phosphate isomerase-like protein (cupin superfamily)
MTPSGLQQRTVSVAAGTSFTGRAGSGGELWFVISGDGLLASREPEGPGREAPAGPDTGIWLPPRTRYRLTAGPSIILNAVSLPVSAAAQPGPAHRSRLAECEVEQTGDRRFRVLFGPGRGCEAATAFVGEIPPGRAPEHTHPYDEIVLVLRGEGVARTRPAGGALADRPLAPGHRVHLPPGLPHCLENTGRDPLVVLGVFHPGGSPAAKTESARP